MLDLSTKMALAGDDLNFDLDNQDRFDIKDTIGDQNFGYREGTGHRSIASKES